MSIANDLFFKCNLDLNLPSQFKPGRCWALVCAALLDSQSHPDVIQTRDCSDASCTEVQCLRPLRQSGAHCNYVQIAYIRQQKKYCRMQVENILIKINII
jgi:hypothetical protein